MNWLAALRLSPAALARAARGLGVIGLALVAACAAPVTDEVTSDGAALVEQSESDYVGDQGGTLGPSEFDPTKVPGFEVGLERTLANAPAKKVLSFNWYGQPNGYWCGPGSLRMLLSTRMSNPPGQPELAAYVGTTTQGTIRVEAVKALNYYSRPEHNPYMSIPMDSRPTQAQRDLLKKTVVSRIASGWPVLANVLSGWRPPGYPSGQIGHFVAIMGYDDSGEKVLIADPAAEGSAGPRWENVPRTYWISMQNLGTWIGGRGYSGDAVPIPDPLPFPEPPAAQK